MAVWRREREGSESYSIFFAASESPAAKTIIYAMSKNMIFFSVVIAFYVFDPVLFQFNSDVIFKNPIINIKL
jgi:hypothetical protein